MVARTALSGITTGVILAVARVSGETAPLLFTAFGNRFWSTSLFHPINTLTVQVYTYAISPFADWQRQAWAGALVLTAIILALELGVRWVTGGAAKVAKVAMAEKLVVKNLSAYFHKNRALKDISLSFEENRDRRDNRPLRMRQVHAGAMPQPDARGRARRNRDRRGAARRQ